MAGLVTGPLAAHLERERERLNARIALRRRTARAFDTAWLSEHVSRGLQPIVNGLATVAPDRLAAATDVLFDIATTLAARSLPAATATLVTRAWATGLAAVPGLVAAAPERLAYAITNAVYNLANTPGARSDAWLARMATLGPGCATPDEWLRCGVIASWRSGMAHLRHAAIAEIARLPDARVADVLGLPGGTPPVSAAQLARRLGSDPWCAPGELDAHGPRVLQLVAAPGGFRGFGGPFLVPPDVTRVDGEFVVFEPDSAWRLFADACGTVLARTSAPAPGEDAHGAFRLDRKGRVRFAGHEGVFPELADASSWAASGDTLVVAVPRSHHVFVVAVAPPVRAGSAS